MGEDDVVLSAGCSSAIGADLPEEVPVCLERSWLCRRVKGGAGATRGRLAGSSYGPELKSLGDDKVAEGTIAESDDEGTGAGGRGLLRSVDWGNRVGCGCVRFLGHSTGSSTGGSELEESMTLEEADRPILLFLA